MLDLYSGKSALSPQKFKSSPSNDTKARLYLKHLILSFTKKIYRYRILHLLFWIRVAFQMVANFLDTCERDKLLKTFITHNSFK